jgi:hypothetical protein
MPKVYVSTAEACQQSVFVDCMNKAFQSRCRDLGYRKFWDRKKRFTTDSFSPVAGI